MVVSWYGQLGGRSDRADRVGLFGTGRRYNINTGVEPGSVSVVKVPKIDGMGIQQSRAV